MNNLKRQIKVNTFNSIQYKIKRYAKLEQVLILDEAFKSAYLDLEKVLSELNRKSDIAKNAISLIYGNENFVYKLKDICQEIFEKLNSNVEVIAFKDPYYDKNLEPVESVFASTKDDSPDNINFYNAFFETEETPIEDKGSIIIHEIAHLVGLKSDRETDSFKSAECVRNFLLLCTGKVSENELFLTEEEAKALEKSGKGKSAKSKKIATRLGEHLYDPDQPRVPAGSSTGGQWSSDGSNGGSSKDDDEDSKDADESEDENTDEVDSNDSENTEDKTQESKNSEKDTPEEKELREENEKIYNELKDGVREILEDEGMSDSEIKETLNGITLDEIKEITNKASDELKAEIEEKLDSLDPSYLASTDDSAAKTDTTSSEKKAEASLNLQAGGIKFDSSKIWGAGNFEINNLEPNKEYTLIGEFSYSYYDMVEGKDLTETSKIAIDIRTDENGSAKVNRLGIVGEYTGDGETAKYAGGELGIGVKLSLAEGKTSDNYEDIDKFKVEDLTHAENRELREKYGLGYYGMFHACQQGWTNTEDIKGYSGGGISGQKDPDGLVEILNESIEFDSETGKSKISKGLKNDAKGRY